jgi:hypothetical protein
MSSGNLSISFRKGNSGEVEKSWDLFQKEHGIWRRKDRTAYISPIDQLIFLLPHLEDRATQRTENEEEATNSQEEEREVPRNV